MAHLRQFLIRAGAFLAVCLLALGVACGGGGGGNSPVASVAPSITTHPASQTVIAPATATFSVAATGTAPLTYQWKKNGVDIPGATSASYTTPATNGADSGSLFAVQVTNSVGNVLSSAATLTVNVTPAITTQPANQTVTAPAAATFTVTATGAPTPTYQWKKNGVDIPGATSASYTTPATSGADSGSQFTVQVSNVAGNVLSSSAALTVNVSPSITAQPLNQTVTAPAAASFSVTAAGTAPFVYQWTKNDLEIPGATSSSYTTPPTSLADSGSLFRVLVSNPFGSVLSNAVTLTVNVAVAITAQPANQIVVAPATATFNVTATGTPAPTYQWKKNAVDIPGATNASYTTPATILADSGTLFTVAVTNLVNSVLSGAATLTVTAAPVAPTITAHPASQTVTAPATGSFSVTATGTAPLNYQWRKNAVDIPGATSSSYTTPATSLADNGSLFSVRVTNSVSNVLSNAATLTVNAAPAITVQPTNQTVTAPATATFNVTATGTATLTYQWKKNAVDIPGAMSASYTTPATTVGDSGSLYTVLVSNAFGNVLSSAATLTVNAAGGLDLTIDGLYITQASQTYTRTVSLVKGRNGFLRVFGKASIANAAAPSVRVRIYNGAVLVNTYTIPAPGASVPTTITEGTLNSSWNVAIPASEIQTGYNILADIDPAGTVAESNEANNQFPVSGTPMALSPVTVKAFRTTFVPVTQSALTGNVTVGNLAAWTNRVERMFPFEVVDSQLISAYVTGTALLADGTGWSALLGEIESKRIADGVAATRYYYGAVATSYASGVAGLGYVPSSNVGTGFRSAIGWDKTGYSDGGNFPEVYAHELGHNFGRRHAPCGGPANPDPGYPYGGGIIGVYGYDVVNNALKAPASFLDIMGYCSPNWISDYTYSAMLLWRQTDAVALPPPPDEDAAPAASPESLLVWGRLEKGAWTLEPAFPMQGTVPSIEAGDCLAEGFDASGVRLFSQSFGLVPVGCGPGLEGEGLFNLAIPMEASVRARLARITVSRGGLETAERKPSLLALFRPERPVAARMFAGSAELVWDDGAYPMAAIRDLQSGEILAFARNGFVSLPGGRKDLEVLLSDGVQSVRRRVQIAD